MALLECLLLLPGVLRLGLPHFLEGTGLKSWTSTYFLAALLMDCFWYQFLHLEGTLNTSKSSPVTPWVPLPLVTALLCSPSTPSPNPIYHFLPDSAHSRCGFTLSSLHDMWSGLANYSVKYCSGSLFLQGNCHETVSLFFLLCTERKYSFQW